MANNLSKRAAARNQERAARAEMAMTQFYDPGSDSNVVDLLADLRHYCHDANIDFYNALRISAMHFEAEQNGED